MCVCVISHLEVALRPEYLGASYRAAADVPQNDRTAEEILAAANWRPAADHMAMDGAARRAQALIATMAG